MENVRIIYGTNTHNLRHSYNISTNLHTDPCVRMQLLVQHSSPSGPASHSSPATSTWKSPHTGMGRPKHEALFTKTSPILLLLQLENTCCTIISIFMITACCYWPAGYTGQAPHHVGSLTAILSKLIHKVILTL